VEAGAAARHCHELVEVVALLVWAAAPQLHGIVEHGVSCSTRTRTHTSQVKGKGKGKEQGYNNKENTHNRKPVTDQEEQQKEWKRNWS
jgi:hypothetical protein